VSRGPSRGAPPTELLNVGDGKSSDELKAIVEGRPDLRIAPVNEEAVVEILAEILLDALAREERSAGPVEAMRQALAGAELALDAPCTPAASARLDRIAGAS
jgi:hypothetical protein